MFKTIFFIFIWLFFTWINNLYASSPVINCAWVPGCADDDITKPKPPNVSDNIGVRFVDNLISNLIEIVAVFAVFALIISGFMYLFSAWDEEKTKRSKKWIIWSLVAVLLSISAWSIINYLNSIQIW